MFEFEPDGFTKIIVFIDRDAGYGRFATDGIFVGDRDDLAQTFISLNGYDDREVEELGEGLGCRVIFYHVPSDAVDDFCDAYGSGDEPVDYETNHRIIFVEEGQGEEDAPSRPMLAFG